jgi:hypothetical protein
VADETKIEEKIEAVAETVSGAGEAVVPKSSRARPPSHCRQGQEGPRRRTRKGAAKVVKAVKQSNKRAVKTVKRARKAAAARVKQDRRDQDHDL